MRGIATAKMLALGMMAAVGMTAGPKVRKSTAEKLKMTHHDVDRIDAAENKRNKRKARNLANRKDQNADV